LIRTKIASDGAAMSMARAKDKMIFMVLMEDRIAKRSCRWICANQNCSEIFDVTVRSIVSRKRVHCIAYHESVWVKQQAI
jgi:hypothetical protein